VITDHSILIGLFDGFSWIRCEGKGSFVNSPAVKTFGDERIAAGETCLVIDLAECTGMDSTFMGTLAGMAARLAAMPGGVLQIASSSERNHRSLEDLGLDFLMEINPSTPIWRGKEEAIRSTLMPPLAPGTLGQISRARHVLDAHRVLTGLNDKNAREFEEVVTLLENELAEKEKLAPQREAR
jgi:anti-anti-sigma regulatory factor